MSAEEGSDPMARAAAAADELYLVRDTYFPADPDEKASRLQTLADAALRLLEAVPPEVRKSALQRASFEHLKGKVLDVFPGYCKEAEDHLSKAVKLNPSLADGWICLGNCIWKKGDLSLAKNFLSAASEKIQNKKILCQLSMLERRLAQGSENQTELVEESIRHAKEAIMLDVKDGNSWYNLGNAYLTNFFVTGAWDHDKLLQSLKAYQNAEKDEEMKSNPDLYFNCATSRAGRLAQKASSSIEVTLNSSHKKATISVLAEGLNRSVAIVGKVLLLIKHDNISPSYCIMCDSDRSCFVLTVYGLHSDAIKEGDRVTLLEPYHRVVEFSWKAKQYKFNSVRVDFLEQLLVDGRTPLAQHAVCSSLHAQHKP